MKKAMAMILAGFVFCGVCATGAMAAGHHGGVASGSTGICSWAACTQQDHVCRQDADGDGLCDVCGADCTQQDHVCRQDADGDGLCDVCGADCTQQDHVCRQDADGDGLCDVCGATCTTAASGHHSHKAGHGHCGR